MSLAKTDQNISSVDVTAIFFCMGCIIFSIFILVATAVFHFVWVSLFESFAVLKDPSFISFFFWTLAGGAAMLFQAALGFGMVYFASLTSKRRVDAATMAVIFMCLPWFAPFLWFILALLIAMTMHPDPYKFALALGLPVVTLLGQYAAYRYVQKTAPSPQVEIADLDFNKLNALDAALLRLLETNNLQDAKHKSTCLSDDSWNFLRPEQR